MSIRELAKQADLDWHKHWAEDETNRLDVFAELVIKETMKVVADNIAWNGYLDAAEAVIKHFEEKE